jgi:hypothetical protein
MLSRFRFAACITAVAGLALFAACKSPQNLPNAQFPNTVDTVTLYALNGTPIGTPSAYALCGGSSTGCTVPQIVHTDQPPVVFDFAFNIDSQAVFLPSGVFPGLQKNSGLQTSNAPSFAAVTTAPTDGYIIDKRLVITEGAVVLLRSRTQICADGSTHSLYGKLHVLGLDVPARTIQFEVVVDQNCGYLSLAPGLPAQ